MRRLVSQTEQFCLRVVMRLDEEIVNQKDRVCTAGGDRDRPLKPELTALAIPGQTRRERETRKLDSEENRQAEFASRPNREWIHFPMREAGLEFPGISSIISCCQENHDPGECEKGSAQGDHIPSLFQLGRVIQNLGCQS